jgi:hypothetical protein
MLHVCGGGGVRWRAGMHETAAAVCLHLAGCQPPGVTLTPHT